MDASARLHAALRMPVFRGYWRFARIAFQASTWLTLTAATVTVISAVAPLAGITVVGFVVGQIPGVIRSGLSSGAGGRAIAGIAVVGGLFVAQSAAVTLQSAVANALGDRVDLTLQRQLMAAVMSPVGIGHLEDPRSLDLINVGRETFRAWLRPGRLATSLSTLASARFVLAGACVILLRDHWPLALLLLATALWAEDEARKASRRAAEHHHGGNSLARRTEYFYETGVTPGAAKEIRVFGLPEFVLERFSATWRQGMSHALARGNHRALVATVALIAVTLLTFGWICVDAVRGTTGLAATMVYAQAVMTALSGVSTSAGIRVDAEMGLTALDKFEAARAATATAAATVTTAGPGRPAAGLPRREIRFEGVTFRYPGNRTAALSGLDLVIPAGRSLAVVGANGAGKTTLVKLLSRMYEPTEGQIRVDGIDLTALDAGDWRRQLAAVFQDYVRYELTVRANIGFGQVTSQDDLAGIQAAAADADVAEAIGRLGAGWDTTLSGGNGSGSDLSGGEWQKIGLARALFAVRHGARVLILDEPAANLDARAEAQLYDRFLALTEGVTTIVISHRFSTVRQASSIAVIGDGRVTEQGSHDELMALDGHYARMFRLQAARFEDAPAGERVVKP